MRLEGNGRWSAASRDLDVDPSAVALPSINIERVWGRLAVSLSTRKTFSSLYKARRLIRSFSGCGTTTPLYITLCIDWIGRRLYRQRDPAIGNEGACNVALLFLSHLFQWAGFADSVIVPDLIIVLAGSEADRRRGRRAVSGGRMRRWGQSVDFDRHRWRGSGRQFGLMRMLLFL